MAFWPKMPFRPEMTLARNSFSARYGYLARNGFLARYGFLAENAFWSKIILSNLKRLTSQSIERVGLPLMAESFQACSLIFFGAANLKSPLKNT